MIRASSLASALVPMLGPLVTGVIPDLTWEELSVELAQVRILPAYELGR